VIYVDFSQKVTQNHNMNKAPEIKTVSAPPPRAGRWMHVWARARALVNDDWLHEERPNRDEARSLYNSAIARNFEAQIRGCSVYIRQRRAEQHVA